MATLCGVLLNSTEALKSSKGSGRANDCQYGDFTHLRHTGSKKCGSVHIVQASRFGQPQPDTER